MARLSKETSIYNDDAISDALASKVSNVIVEYAVGTSSTVAPTSGWSTSSPTWEAGKYVWQRTTVTAGGQQYPSTACIQGAKGEKGNDGTGVTILGNYATEADLRAAHPTGYPGDAYLVAGDLYVWDGSDWSNVGTIQGPAGTDGADGRGITSITHYYAATDSTEAPADSAFSTIVANPTATNRYLWNYAVVAYSSGNPDRTAKRIIGVYGEQGIQGPQGVQGVQGPTGPEALVSVYPTTVDFGAGTATLTAVLLVNGTAPTSTPTYQWMKGSTLLGTAQTQAVTDLSALYMCVVSWGTSVQAGSFDFGSLAEAAAVAGNYIVETASNDVWVHSEGHGPNSIGVATSDTYGWRIGSVFELVRAGVTYIKMWVDNVAKLMLGVDTSGHVLLDSTGMEVMNSTTSLAKFGTTTRVGSESAGHATLSSTGMEVFTDESNSVAEFGSTTRIGLENSGHVELESTGMEVFTNASTSVAKFAASLIEIGKNATSAVIKFCNGKGTIEYNADSSPSSSEDYSSTSYFEVKGADLRLNGTSRAALYSYYTNGSNIGRKTSVITKPAELKMFSESSSNLSGDVGTWAMGIIDVTPNGVSIEANSNGSGKIDLLSANNMTLQSTAGQLKLSGSTYSITSPNLFLRALGMAKTKGDSFTVYSVNAVGYLSNSRKTATVTVYFPYLVYGTTSNTSCTLSGSFYARQNNGYCFGSTASANVSLSSFTVTISRIQSGCVTFNVTGGEQTLAINNDPISVYFSSLTVTLT